MKRNILLLVVIALMAFGSKTFAQAKQAESAPITIESYYKTKWGYADEFIALWKKNHYPLLKKLLEKGDILSIKAETPIIHSSEDSRWDFKVILTFKNEHLALDYSIVDPFKKQLFPDQESYKKAEQHRFELIIAHWDVLVEAVVLN
ncbi:MAG: hypothetical protein JWQ63_583 [Mucilaginibacter sp.]|jgi:hypothetical protein|nr:hypothetical protein [Mucilaginibacter sp.]